MLTADFVEREYNNRKLVPQHPAYFTRWEKDSAFVRETLTSDLEIRYGPDPRHRIDLFPAPKARGTLLFLHGGYWRALDKSVFSWLAASWAAAGVNVAMPNYRLAPHATIEEIVGDAIAATNWLMLNGGKHGVATDRVVVSGHSAGAHLSAALFATPWSRLKFDPARIVGGVAFSGIFDFEPMLQFSFNSDYGLDRAAVERLNLQDKKPTIEAPLVIAVGGAESSEFQRQSRLLADAWRPRVKSHLVLPGLNHFSIVDSFAERGQPLYEATLALF
jgi:arylformamidase